MIQDLEESIENTPMPLLESGITIEEQDTNNIEINDTDDHLPRVQVELDKLNYANESINNLELELEESKREYLQTMKDTEEQLSLVEKKLGNCVEKSRPYYEARIDLNEARDKYLKAKNRFETAQELYVAAKNMQMYAEENLENFSIKLDDRSSSNYDKETLIKMLEIAKIKVNDTELSKQSSDIEQIEAYKVYEEKQKKVEEMEKNLKKSIEKSRKYFELKSSLYKELRFLFTKIEGLKSCLKEAKSTYQQSLRNLELISTEIHTQRKTISLNNSNNSTSNKINDENLSKLTSNSNSTLSSSSSSLSLAKSVVKSFDHTTTDETDLKTLENETEQEDYDVYFKNDLDNKAKKEIELKSFSRNNSDKINTSLLISDDDIEHLKLDNKLKLYKENLDENKKTDEIILKIDLTSASSKSSSLPNSPSLTHANTANRPQFRIPTLFK